MRNKLEVCSLCKHFSNTSNAFKEWHCNLHVDEVSITFPHEQSCDDFSSSITCENCKYVVRVGFGNKVCRNSESIGFDSVCKDTDVCNKWENK